MNASQRQTTLILGALAVAVGCQTSTSPGVPVFSMNYCARADSVRNSLRAVFPAQPGAWTDPYENALASMVVPGGFGGYYRDVATSRLVVLLRDTTRAEAATAALADAVACGSLFPTLLVREGELRSALTRRATYDAVQLLSFYQSVSQTLVPWDSCGAAIGISWERNAVKVEVGNPALAETARNAFMAAGVPPDALWMGTICIGQASGAAPASPVGIAL